MTVRWGELTEVEIAHARDHHHLVLIPVGATEQHGAHLPTDTDVSLADAVAVAVAERLGDTLVIPAVPWGYSRMHMGFASTLTLSPDTLAAVLHDLCSSMIENGFRKLALVVAHAINRPVAQLVTREVKHRHGVTIAHVNYAEFGRDVFARVRRTPPGGDMHGGEFETALQLHLRPDLVHMDRAEADPVDPVKHFGSTDGPTDIFAAGRLGVGYRIREIFPTGVMGDPRPATADQGAEIFAAIVDGITKALDDYRRHEYDTPRT
jgi:creatinine amidohydrolase